MRVRSRLFVSCDSPPHRLSSELPCASRKSRSGGLQTAVCLRPRAGDRRSLILFRDRHFRPAFSRFGEFPRRETPDDYLLLCEIVGVLGRVTIKVNAHRRCARTACADEVRRIAHLQSHLIDQPGMLRQEIVVNERVTVAEEQEWTIRVRLDGSAVFLAHTLNRNLFCSWFRRFLVKKSDKVSRNLRFLPFGNVFGSSAGIRQFRTHLFRDRM